MSNQSTETQEFEDRTIDTQFSTMDARSRAMDVATNVTERSKDGSLAILVGGTLLARALWSHRRVRAVVLAVIGAALVGFGLRQRRSEGGIFPTDATEPVDQGEMGTVEERAESHRPDANPRGTADEPDVETKTAPDEGEVQFTTDQTEDPRSKPTLDEDDRTGGDPRLDEDDGTTEVDLSEAALADEASEAAGPTPEQAQPAQTEDTEPEVSPPEDASRMQTDEADQSETDPNENEDQTKTRGDEAKDENTDAA